MNKSYALRKGRYVDFTTDHLCITGRISDSSVIKKSVLCFDIFNIPVECIELEKGPVLVKNNILHILNVVDYDSIKDHEKKGGVLIEEEDRLFIPLSLLNFTSEEKVNLFRKLRRQL